MKNEEKYKTAEERVRLFNCFCLQRDCETCEFDKEKTTSLKAVCFARWLALEAEDGKLEDCPFCGGETRRNSGHIIVDKVHYWVDCISPDCMYRSAHYTDKDAAIAAHNRVCRAVEYYKTNKEA